MVEPPARADDNGCPIGRGRIRSENSQRRVGDIKDNLCLPNRAKIFLLVMRPTFRTGGRAVIETDDMGGCLHGVAFSLFSYDFVGMIEARILIAQII